MGKKVRGFGKRRGLMEPGGIGLHRRDGLFAGGSKLMPILEYR
jgi:hypothetical protein